MGYRRWAVTAGTLTISKVFVVFLDAYFSSFISIFNKKPELLRFTFNVDKVKNDYLHKDVKINI